MKKIHYSWVICFSCTLLLFCTVGIASSAFSVHQPYIISENGFSNTQASLIITIKSLSSVVFMLFADKVATKFGAMRCAVAMLFVEALGFGLYGLAESVMLYYVGSVLAGISQSIGGMVLASIIISKWFEDRKALAISICSAGTGIATIICPIVVTALAESYSLHVVFYAECAFMALCAVIVLLTMREDPAAKGLKPYTAAKHDESKSAAYGGNAPLSTFVCVVIAVFILGAVMGVDTAYISTLYRGAGHSSAAVAGILSSCGIILIISKLLYGSCVDKFGTYKTNYIFIVLLLIGQLLHCFAASSNLILAYIAEGLMGVGLPVATVGLTVTATDFSSAETFPKRMKIVQVALVLGTLAFSTVPGILADVTGGYLISFQIAFGMTIVYGILMQSAYIRMRRGKKA